MPEFCGKLSQFQTARSKLQGYARSICHVTKELYTLQRALCEIHEYWMESGMHDLAHDLIPILDKSECSWPQNLALGAPLTNAIPIPNSQDDVATIHLPSRNPGGFLCCTSYHVVPVRFELESQVLRRIHDVVTICGRYLTIPLFETREARRLGGNMLALAMGSHCGTNIPSHSRLGRWNCERKKIQAR